MDSSAVVQSKPFPSIFSEDLYRALKRTKKPGFSERELRKYTMDMLKCLQLLKKNNIVHGDLKTVRINASEMVLQIRGGSIIVCQIFVCWLRDILEQ